MTPEEKVRQASRLELDIRFAARSWVEHNQRILKMRKTYPYVHIIGSKETLTVAIEEMRGKLIERRAIARHAVAGMATTDEIHSCTNILGFCSLGDIEFLIGIAGKQHTLLEIRLLFEGKHDVPCSHILEVTLDDMDIRIGLTHL